MIHRLGLTQITDDTIAPHQARPHKQKGNGFPRSPLRCGAGVAPPEAPPPVWTYLDTGSAAGGIRRRRGWFSDRNTLLQQDSLPVAVVLVRPTLPAVHFLRGGLQAVPEVGQHQAQ